MKKYKVIFADLDSTLIDTISGEIFPKGIWDMKIKFDVLDKIKELEPNFLFIVSNQGGIEKGFVNEYHFYSKLAFIVHSIEEYCGIAVDSYYCSNNDKDNKNRKPNYGMLEKAISDYNLIYNNHDYCITIYKKSEMLMIGDASSKPGQFSDSDKKTAENFGIDYMDINDFVNTNLED